MKRCRICGRPPSEECCTDCHRVHRKTWEATRGNGRYKTLARQVLAGLDQVNTEEVNQ